MQGMYQFWDRVKIGYGIHKYPQWTNIPSQDLSSHLLTVVAIAGPHCQFRTLHWHHFNNCEFTWLAKFTLENRTVYISQCRHSYEAYL